MFSLLLSLLMHGMYMTLRVGGLSGSFPKPLSAERERECLKRMQGGDQEARNELILHNLRLVAHIIKKYYTNQQDQDDLISIGTIGLIKAISTFNAEKGSRLATYAARCIENEILMHFRAQKKTASEVSLSEPIETDKEGNSLELLDILSQEDDVLEKMDAEDTEKRLYRCVREILQGRERMIIMLRYGLGGREPHTQREIAKAMGISRSYVSRLEKKALLRLRNAFDQEG